VGAALAQDDDTVEHFFELIRPHLSTIALALTWIGVGYAAWRNRSHWRRKQFNATVNFSLNYVHDNTLAMRTLLEADTSRVWLNDYGAGLITAACKKTTAEQPFLLLQDPDDHVFVNRAVLNVLSERFAESYVAAAIGVPVWIGTFYFVLSYERYDIMRTFKLRVLVIEEKTLVRLFGPENEAARLRIGDPWHQARLNTLRGMHDLYLKNATAAQPLLHRVELGVVA
jgi:hypothetical protein